MPGSLTQALLPHLPEDLAARARSEPGLEEKLQSVCAAARAAWPSVDVSDDEFLAFLGARLDAGEGDLAARLDALRTADLYLACGCALGRASALECVERHHFPDLARAVARVRGAEKMVDEALQKLREVLFIPGGARAGKISDYRGRSLLKRWLRTAAVRTALNLVEGEPRSVREGEEVLLNLSLCPTDLELSYMKELYRGEFQAALREAVASLDPEQRTLLRQYHADGLSLEQLATAYRVHAATISRRLDKARAAILSRCRRLLGARLGVSRAELESILRMIRSQLELSGGAFDP